MHMYIHVYAHVRVTCVYACTHTCVIRVILTENGQVRLLKKTQKMGKTLEDLWGDSKAQL